MKHSITLLSMVAACLSLTGCALSQSDVQKMSPAEAYYCAVDGGTSGVWRKNDFNGYCRQRVAELEKNGQLLDSDKVQALRAGAGY